MSRTTLIVVAVVAVLGIGGGVFFYTSFEKRVVTVERGPSGEARVNQFLAAERLLSRLGVPTRSEPAINQVVPGEVDLILFLAPARRSTEVRSDRLLTWVEAGGHLVVAARDATWTFDWAADDGDEGLSDPLLDPWDIEAVAGGQGFRGPPVAVGASEEDALSFLFPTSVVLLYPPDLPDWVLADERGARALSLPWGEGRVTVLASPAPFGNGEIGQAEHARLLWRLATRWGRPTQALVVYADEFPGLFALFGRHAWALLVSLGTLLVVALYGASRRFGPPLPDPEPDRRSLLEHLDAAGAFLWRQRARQRLLEGVRETLRDRIRRRRPELAQRAPAEQVEPLAQTTGLAPPLVADALSGPVPSRPEEFVRAVQRLETLRRSL